MRVIQNTYRSISAPLILLFLATTLTLLYLLPITRQTQSVHKIFKKKLSQISCTTCNHSTKDGQFHKRSPEGLGFDRMKKQRHHRERSGRRVWKVSEYQTTTGFFSITNQAFSCMATHILLGRSILTKTLFPPFADYYSRLNLAIHCGIQAVVINKLSSQIDTC